MIAREPVFSNLNFNLFSNLNFRFFQHFLSLWNCLYLSMRVTARGKKELRRPSELHRDIGEMMAGHAGRWSDNPRLLAKVGELPGLTHWIARTTVLLLLLKSRFADAFVNGATRLSGARVSLTLWATRRYMRNVHYTPLDTYMPIKSQILFLFCFCRIRKPKPDSGSIAVYMAIIHNLPPFQSVLLFFFFSCVSFFYFWLVCHRW